MDMKKLKPAGIYRREDGRFHIRATAKDPITGKIREKRRTPTLDEISTIQEAITERERMKAEIRRPPEDQGPRWHTVADYAERWWSRRAPTLAPSTKANDERILSRWVLPYIGHLQIETLSRSDVVNYVAKLNQATKPDGSSYSRATRRCWWVIAKQLLLDLKAEAGLDQNPIERVKPPSRDGGNSRCRKTLDAKGLDEFLEAAKRMKPRRYPEILTLGTTGMRPSGMYGLRWPDIEYDEETIHIRRSASDGVLHDSPKTGEERKLPLDDELAEELRAHRKEQLRKGGRMVDSGLVFPSTKGTPRRSSSIRKPMHQISDAMGLGFRVGPQVMRRSVNNILREAGVDQITIRGLMGHSSPQMTELYSHVDLSAKRKATSILKG